MSANDPKWTLTPKRNRNNAARRVVACEIFPFPVLQRQQPPGRPHGNLGASGDRHEEAGNRYRRHCIDRNARVCG
jgi:hypothetical protein